MHRKSRSRLTLCFCNGYGRVPSSLERFLLMRVGRRSRASSRQPSGGVCQTKTRSHSLLARSRRNSNTRQPDVNMKRASQTISRLRLITHRDILSGSNNCPLKTLSLSVAQSLRPPRYLLLTSTSHRQVAATSNRVTETRSRRKILWMRSRRPRKNACSTDGHFSFRPVVTTRRIPHHIYFGSHEFLYDTYCISSFVLMLCPCSRPLIGALYASSPLFFTPFVIHFMDFSDSIFQRKFSALLLMIRLPFASPPNPSPI